MSIELIDNTLSYKETTDFLKANDIVFFQNIEEVKTNLQKMANECANINYTENKELVIEFERKTREARYTLNNYKKNALSFFNSAKDKAKEEVEALIAIIEPSEKRLKGQIEYAKNLVEEEKMRIQLAQEERGNRFNSLLEDWRRKFDECIKNSTLEEDLKVYENLLDELKSTFSIFEEFEYKAQQLHALYTGRKSEIISKLKAIEDAKQVEILRKELFETRSDILRAKGFIIEGKFFYHKIKNITIGFDAVVMYNKIDFEGFLHSVDNVPFKKQEVAANQEKQALKQEVAPIVKEEVVKTCNIKQLAKELLLQCQQKQGNKNIDIFASQLEKMITILL